MESKNEECVLCCREISIYATGICDHPVCYECSARMRVLCETNECPICRSDMPLVVFTHQLCTYSNVSDKFSLCNKKYYIIFEDKKALEAFELLLINKCPNCSDIFPNFEKLKDHVRRKHELHYCDLCSNSLKIFTFERKCYNRQDLARHKRKGDPDNTSHRGHPLCEFCDMRYIDYDELYKHLRREHFFCHFCDADGQHQYYRTYDYLRVHFRTDHYLCEDGDCANEKFTAVFRTEIDLKAHKATTHSKNKSKAEARQARVLDLEFSYAPHPRPTGNSSPRGRRYAQPRRNAEMQNSQSHPKNQPETEPLNTESTQEFPYLSEDSVNYSGCVRKPPPETGLSLQSFNRNPPPQPRRSNMMSVEDFPALGSSASVSDTPLTQSRKFEPTAYKQNVSNAQAPPVKKSDSDNPKTIGNMKQNNQNATPKWLAKKDKSNFEEAFPQLAVKKTLQPTVTTSSSQSRAASVPNNTTPSASDPPQEFEEFVIIKGKSKKKNQKAPAMQEEKGDDSSEKWQESISTMNGYSVLSNQENRIPIRPSMPMRPPPMQESEIWETKASFRKDDFPPLETAKRPPPGLSIKKTRAPPPGFKPETNIVNSSSNLSMSSIAKIVENSLKNNMNSDKLNGSHNFSSDNYEYQDPPGCQLRNERLIHTISSVCGTSENFQKFKSVSRNFRCNTISALEYHTKCLEILGEEEFQVIFSELVCLLPDITKQQELLAVHNKYVNSVNSNAKRKNKFKSFKNNVVSCKLCNQVLLVDDCNSHNCASVSVT